MTPRTRTTPSPCARSVRPRALPGLRDPYCQPHGIWGGRPQAELQRLIARDRDGRPRRALIAAAEHHNAAKTRCRRGHPFDTANTYYDAAGRRCRACLRAAWHRWKAERASQPTPPRGVVWMPEPSVLSPDTAIADLHAHASGGATASRVAPSDGMPAQC